MTRIGLVFSGFSHRVAAAALTAVLLSATAIGCGSARGISLPDRSSAVSTTDAAVDQRIVLRFDHAIVAATLVDTAAGRGFAAQLPLTLDLPDRMGQARSGPLPAEIDTSDSDPVLDPDAGGLYYVLGSRTLAVFYDDLGQTVPPPGLIRVGSVDGDLDSIATSGNRVLIDLADRTSS